MKGFRLWKGRQSYRSPAGYFVRQKFHSRIQQSYMVESRVMRQTERIGSVKGLSAPNPYSRRNPALDGCEPSKPRHRWSRLDRLPEDRQLELHGDRQLRESRCMDSL